MTRMAPCTVGILSRRIPDDLERIFGPPTRFFAECCVAAEQLGLRAVVFEADDLDPKRDAVAAATFSQGRWIHRETLRLPEVIYDRASVYDLSYRPAIDRARIRLIEAGLPFINPFALLKLAADKSATYDRLTGYGLRLPDTALLEPGVMMDFLDRYDHLFLKPIHGSNGTGIMEIQRRMKTGFLFRCGLEQYETQTVQQLQEMVISRTGNPASENSVYLVQQGITTENLEARRFPRFDLRVIMQKDEHKAWGLTGVVARVSQSDIPTTNLSTGARAEVAESVLDSLYGPLTREATLKSVMAMCLTICQGLDRDVCPFGELGIDIVTDAEGQPWIIEINAKPGRHGFKRIAYSEDVTEAERLRFQHIRNVSVAMPFRYAATLRAGDPLS